MTQAALEYREAEHAIELGTLTQMSIIGTYIARPFAACRPALQFTITVPTNQACQVNRSANGDDLMLLRSSLSSSPCRLAEAARGLFARKCPQCRSISGGGRRAHSAGARSCDLFPDRQRRGGAIQAPWVAEVGLELNLRMDGFAWYLPR